MTDKIAWVLLAEKNRPNKKLRELAKSFDTKKKSVSMSSDEAVQLMDDIERAERIGARLITYIDTDYPEELRHIAYPPPYLFVRGNVKLLSHPVKVTMVGSREATAYGMNTAHSFASELAANGVCIVSGGARGIDTAALRGAMTSGGDVIAVLGCGIDIDYPPENRELFDRIAQKGVIVSEFRLGMEPLPNNFPIRNRVMTALADSVVVVEAAGKSGALISAGHALEQGKTLFAVPGNIDSPNSVGTNQLLRDGAQFALSGSDILYELMDTMPDKFRRAQELSAMEDSEVGPEGTPTEKEEIPSHLSQMEKAVVNAIKSGKYTYEAVLEFTAMEPGKLTSLLTIMEIKGIIKLAFGNRYRLND